MSLLNLLYLEESQADIAIAAVHRWCSENGCEISSDDGKKAVAVAAGLAKSTDSGGSDLLGAISQEMAAMAQPIKVHTVLVLEAEPFIALDMELTLEKAGIAVYVCFTQTEALQWLTSKTPSAAILDFKLRDGVSTDVASVLKTRGVPILFCSGAHPSEVTSIFGESSRLPKPFDYQQLTDLVRHALEIRNVQTGGRDMLMQHDKPDRRPRGPSSFGTFAETKALAAASEEARVAADKRKTAALREARFRRELEAIRASS
ncbi:hypothetical protein OIU34_00515 [Pararhizobium sp. BT-229]|uniref:hypothetical protein n=1 Tax=Pararhizobium sp. BT-229 TaxID=2986923 RepID=UPI0021F6D20E|nr:hypothetical protein [Pararhizobium sp. BT-229]MCV9960368.1 hypothetical protein [Pararhizobium sp. BT-229]